MTLTKVLAGVAALALAGFVSARRPSEASDRASPAQSPGTQRPAVAADRFVDSVLARLTLQEKLGQLTQYRGLSAVTGPQTPEAGAADIRAGRVGSFLGTYGAQVTRDLQRVAVEQSRARIPLLFAHDVIHGFRTIFPVPLA